MFPQPPVIRFTSEKDTCLCRTRLTVQKTRNKTVLSMNGPFIARETLLQCPVCSEVFASDALLRLVQRRCNIAYDVLVFVGQTLFQRHLTTKEVRAELVTRNVYLSASEIGYLGRKYIKFLAVGHRQATPRIRHAMKLAGGYILHLDATHDGDAPALMTGMDDLSKIVLANVKLPSENSDHIVPFLRRLLIDYGTPQACVHDMGTGICKAVGIVFPGIPDVICHFHFLRDIGKDFLEPAYSLLRKRLRHHATHSRLSALVRETRKILIAQNSDTDLLAKAIRTLDSQVSKDILPIAATYSFALWALRGRHSGNGYGFPFDRPLLEFAERLTELEHRLSEALSMFTFGNRRDNRQYRKKLETNQKQMKIWADNCPENFLHKYLLVQAEIARIKGGYPEAAELYRNAAEEAGKNEFIYDEALANELEAKLRLAQGEDNNAAIPMAGAHNCYKHWGALGKVKDMEEKYPQLLAEKSAKQSIGGIQTKSIPFMTRGANMDLASLMKASQAISGEIHLDRLLADLMRIVMESAGAQTAFFILNKKGELLIEADAVSYENVNVLQSVPVKTATSLSQSVIFYVFRTEKLVVLNDAANKGQFVNDPYIRENKTKSLLCIPLFSKKKLIGIIYLENNLATGTFTSERTEVLQLLSSQAAISVENAMLYSGIESKVRERTSQLNRTLSEVKQNIRDIRDLKQKVEGEKEQFQRLTEATFEGILIYENGRIIETNKPAQDMFGMQRFELTGKNPTDLISAEEPGSLENMDIEAPYGIRKDGSRFPIEVQTKPINWYGKSVRVAAIRDITWRKKIEKENIALKHTLKGRYKLGDIIGKSEKMQDVYEQIAGAAGVDFNVIIYGESGTGKELAARTVHRLSSRNNKPFVPVNCGAVQETLFESEFSDTAKGLLPERKR